MQFSSALPRKRALAKAIHPSFGSIPHPPTLPSMAILKAGRQRPLAVLPLHFAVVGVLATVTAQAPPPPPHPQLLTPAAGRTVPATTVVVTIAAVAFFVLVVFCVFVNQWRRSSADVDAGAGAGGRHHGSVRRRWHGLDPAALAALPVVPYAEIRKHRSGGGGEVLECAVCLAAFGDGDELRLLPQCSHAFHPECIDPWLQGHVTCPLCRANLEKPAPPPRLSSPESKPPQMTPDAAVAVRVEAEDGSEEEEERKQEAAELEKLRCVRRAARMLPRSRSTGHSSAATAAAADTTGCHERFTVRLPPHAREEVLRSRRLRHATSLVVTLDGAGSSTAGSPCGERCHGARRRWAASLLSRTTSWAWAQGGGEGSSARMKGVGPAAEAGARRPPCGHVVCSLVARWPARCKAKNLA